MRRMIPARLALSVVLSGCKVKELADKAQIAKDLDKKGTVDLMKEVANDKYDPPKDGKLTEAQVQMYLKVRQHEKDIAKVAKQQMEEVSLEQLLEGRERPATLSGAIPVPIPEDVEELGAEEMVAVDENPLGVSPLDELPPLEPLPMTAPAPAANDGKLQALEARVRQLEGSLNDVLRTLNDLTSRLKNQIGQ